MDPTDFDNERGERKRNIINSIKMTLTRDQIMSFVSGLHETQMELIEVTVNAKERQGFPEANAVIKYVMGLPTPPETK